MAEKDSDKINKMYKGKTYKSQRALDRAKAKVKKDKSDRKSNRKKEMDEFTETVRKNNALIKAGRGNQTRTVQERRDIKKNIEKAKESNKKNVTVKPSSPTAPKKFDYKNKSKTKFSAMRARRAARGRTSADIAKDPSFMKNTSKGKYLRGLHFALKKQGMASGGAVNKPSTKPSAGNKWN